ncbi:MAG: protein-disulfide reductase DsbD domain-containing protein, partial [Akkermansiaceae bacterium]
MKPLKLSLFFLLSFILPLSAQFDPFAGGEDEKSNATKSEMFADVTAIAPGDSFTVALKLTHAEGWHSYYKNPGYVGDIPEIDWKLPEGFKASAVQFPIPHISQMEYGSGKINTYGYEGTNYFLVEITAPATLPDSFTLVAMPKWQICDSGSSCVPEPFPGNELKFELTLKKAAAKTIDASKTKEFETARAQQPLPLNESDWQIEAFENNKGIFLILTPQNDNKAVPADLYFYSSDKQTDAQAEQKFIEQDGKYVLVIPRFVAEEDGLLPAVAKLETISGIVTSADAWKEGQPSHGIKFSIPL